MPDDFVPTNYESFVIGSLVMCTHVSHHVKSDEGRMAKVIGHGWIFAEETRVRPAEMMPQIIVRWVDPEIGEPIRSFHPDFLEVV